MLVCAGTLSMLVFQVFENIGMTTGIMPITGIPLPLLSYGGSSTMAFLVLDRPRPERPHAPLRLSRSRRRLAALDIGAVAAERRTAGAARRTAGRLAPRMSSLWPRLEPLLAQVQKPARYIGAKTAP